MSRAATLLVMVALVLLTSACGGIEPTPDPTYTPYPTYTPIPTPTPTPTPLPTPTPTPTPVPTPTPTPVAEPWKTYVSEINGYSFEYPGSWEVQLRTVEQGTKALVEYYIRGPKGATINAHWTLDVPYDLDYGVDLRIESLTRETFYYRVLSDRRFYWQGGYEARELIEEYQYRISDPVFQQRTLFLKAEGQEYQIDAYVERSEFERYALVFDRAVASFRILGPLPTWATYNNALNNYAISYPSAWRAFALKDTLSIMPLDLRWAGFVWVNASPADANSTLREDVNSFVERLQSSLQDIKLLSKTVKDHRGLERWDVVYTHATGGMGYRDQVKQVFIRYGVWQYQISASSHMEVFQSYLPIFDRLLDSFTPGQR